MSHPRSLIYQHKCKHSNKELNSIFSPFTRICSQISRGCKDIIYIYDKKKTTQKINLLFIPFFHKAHTHRLWNDTLLSYLMIHKAGDKHLAFWFQRALKCRNSLTDFFSVQFKNKNHCFRLWGRGYQEGSEQVENKNWEGHTPSKSFWFSLV